MVPVSVYTFGKTSRQQGVILGIRMLTASNHGRLANSLAPHLSTRCYEIDDRTVLLLGFGRE